MLLEWNLISDLNIDVSMLTELLKAAFRTEGHSKPGPTCLQTIDSNQEQSHVLNYI